MPEITALYLTEDENVGSLNYGNMETNILYRTIKKVMRRGYKKCTMEGVRQKQIKLRKERHLDIVVTTFG